MTPLLWALILAAPPGPAQVLEIRMEQIGARPALTLVANGPLGVTSLDRGEKELVLTVGASMAPRLAVPVVVAPVTGVSLDRGAGVVRIHVHMSDPGVPYELRRSESRLSIVFGEAALPSPPASEATVEDLYRMLLPPPSGVESSPPVRPPGDSTEEAERGLRLGAFRFRPRLTVSFVDGSTALLETAEPVPSHYFEIDPQLGIELSLLDGRLKADYEPRFRLSSPFPILRHPTHLANGALNLPVGAGGLTFRVRDHFARGTLETQEVDPGREYFFALGEFTRNQVEGGARVQLGGAWDFDVSGTLNRVRLTPATAFFDYDSRQVRGALGLQATGTLRLRLEYAYDRVPPSPQRALIESSAHTAGVGAEGQITPLLYGTLNVGYRSQDSPRAPADGALYRGLTASGQLTRELGPSSVVTLSLNRSTQISAFEQNAFYVANSVQAQVRLPLVAGVLLDGGMGFQRNDYRIPAQGLADPRRDRLVGWSVGLTRPLKEWAFLRADYRAERRRSNISALENSTHVFVAQLGIGYRQQSPR